MKDYKGSRTYMAPEILERKMYDGRKADIFSLGVILFLTVLAKFPFREAKEEDGFYKLIKDN